MENYKKWIVIAIIAAAAAIAVIAATSSRHKKEAPATAERDELTSPSGPMLGPEPIRPASVFPDDPVRLAAIGDTYFEKQNYQQAVIVYEKLLSLDPSDVDTHNDLGLAYLYTGRKEKAVATLKKGIELDPSYQRIWLTTGFTYLTLKNEEEARKALKKAVELDPGSTIGKEAERMLGLF